MVYVIVVFALADILFVLLEKPKGANVDTKQSSELSDFRVSKESLNKLCGPFALYVAINRLGIPVGFSEIANAMAIDENGVSFGDIVQLAKMKHLDTRLCRLNWNTIIGIGAPVVLWVDGNHFITVDPRESNAEKDEVCVYEHGIPATWYLRDKLEERWKGESLVIRLGETMPSEEDPGLKWDVCLQDCGFVKPDAECDYVYNYKNTSSFPISLEIKKLVVVVERHIWFQGQLIRAVKANCMYM